MPIGLNLTPKESESGSQKYNRLLREKEKIRRQLYFFDFFNEKSAQTDAIVSFEIALQKTK